MYWQCTGTGHLVGWVIPSTSMGLPLHSFGFQKDYEGAINGEDRWLMFVNMDESFEYILFERKLGSAQINVTRIPIFTFQRLQGPECPKKWKIVER